MLMPFPQNWRTSFLPYSISLANRVNTGGSWTTPSETIANQKWWATRGLQGYGPKIQYRGAGMDGLGCGCGCNGSNGDGGSFFTWVLIGAGVMALLHAWHQWEHSAPMY